MRQFTARVQNKILKAIKEAEKKGINRIVIQEPKHSLKRPCTRCGKMFVPNGKYSKICEKCSKKNKKKIHNTKTKEEHTK
jgi:uncharacterized OB-fold protein